MVGVLKLFRTPLKEGEGVYALGNIDAGVFEDGVHKGDKKPKIHSLKPSIIEDGRLCWEMLDSEANRAFCESMLPQIENPPFAYSIGYPEDEVDEDEEVEVLGDEAKTTFEPSVKPVVLKRRGRKPKAKPPQDEEDEEG